MIRRLRRDTALRVGRSRHLLDRLWRKTLSVW